MMPAHRPGGSRPWRDLLDLVATVLVIAVAVTFLFNMRRTDVAAARPAGRPVPPRATDGPIEGIRVSLAGASTIGRASAPAVLIVYSDFQCPSCARFALETMPRLVKEYVAPGELLIAFRHLPLAAIHPFAVKAAEYAVCAERQEKFWAFHDLAFEEQRLLSDAQLLAWTKRVGTDDARLQACLKESAPKVLQREAVGAKALFVSATPSLFVGRRQTDGSVKLAQRLSGAASFEQVKRLLTPSLPSVPSTPGSR